MMGQRFGKCIALCLLPWSCLSFAWSDDAAGPGTASPGSGHIRKGLARDIANGTYMHSNISAAPQPSGSGSRAAVAASLLSGAVILVLSVSFAVCCWRDRTRRSREGQQHRRKVRGGWKHDPSTPEMGRNAFGRLKHYHRRDYHLSALSSSVFPGAFAGCNNLAFQRSPENLPKLPLQSCYPKAQVLPQLVLQPSTPPINALPSQTPRNIPLPAMPCHADLPSHLLPLYEEHKLFNKFRKPV
ncbi:uncharacterized protein LOC141923776 [Strix aluco]|uniref:uncharacterized protein LOC141923776 n=1 Tax=Strix aluco TaxID=111821 RepID=UPI003DA2F283